MTAVCKGIITLDEGGEAEIYRKIPKEDITESLQAEKPVDFDRRQELYKELGLEEQAKRALPLDPALFWHEVKSIEREIWRVFLPKQYSGHGWTTYEYDTIPDMCLAEISFAKKVGLFNELVIRTPEPIIVTPKVEELIIISDPACFAHTEDGRQFLVTRWGESLQPLEQIAKTVFTQKWWEKQRRPPKTMICTHCRHDTYGFNPEPREPSWIMQLLSVFDVPSFIRSEMTKLRQEVTSDEKADSKAT